MRGGHRVFCVADKHYIAAAYIAYIHMCVGIRDDRNTTEVIIYTYCCV